MVLPNRIIMSPMVTNYAAADGEATEQLIRYHVERVRGGTALNILEATFVEPCGISYYHGTSMADDEVIPSMRQLTSAVHEAGGRIAVQLQHGGRLAMPQFSQHVRLIPSYIPGVTPYEESRVMTRDDIQYLVRRYAEAAVRARRCGFDAVEIHGAHGYLIAQFLSPFTNHRTDEYGGSSENRMRFAVEVLRAVRRAVGPDYPLSIRLSVDEMYPGALTLDMGKEVARTMVDNGVDMINVSVTVTESGRFSSSPANMPKGYNAERAAAIREAIGGRVPVAVVGRIHDRRTAEAIIEKGQADLVVIGRGHIADPGIAGKMMTGRDDEIIPCLSCNEGCIWNMAKGGRVACAVNPRTGFEGVYTKEKAASVKKVVVVGAGPAGIQAALTASERGHEVILLEKRKHIGGMLRVAGLAPHKDTFVDLLTYYEKALQRSSVDVHLECEATVERIRNFGADAVIVAVGSMAVIPSFCGEAPVKTAEDVLQGAAVGQNVLVLGGGLVGSEAAEFLAMKGKNVTILELREGIAMDMEPRHKGFLAVSLSELKVKTIVRTEVISIKSDKSVLVKDRVRGEYVLPAFDDIVLALGYRPETSLMAALASAGMSFIPVGDCVSVGKIWNATTAGFRAAYSL